MPFYEVFHSYPLQTKQKSQLAETITKLHATTFTTPSVFVHVRFTACDASERNYFVAGESKETSENRITGLVRTSDKRKKEDFDRLGEKLEDLWYDVVSGERVEEDGKDKGKRKGEVEETAKQREAKKLRLVVFYPMIAIRELGFTIPQAGQEGPWYKDNLDHFIHLADAKGDEDIAGMLKEMEVRDDLKKLIT